VYSVLDSYNKALKVCVEFLYYIFEEFIISVLYFSSSSGCFHMIEEFRKFIVGGDENDSSVIVI